MATQDQCPNRELEAAAAALSGSLHYFLMLLFRSQRQEILDELRSIQTKLETIMAKQTDFEEGFRRIDAATTAIADKIRSLQDIIGSNMTAEQEDQVKAQLDNVAAALEAMGQNPDNPVPVDPSDTTNGGTGGDTVGGGTGSDTTGGGSSESDNSGSQP